MQNSNNDWKAVYFQQTSNKEEFCLICKKICISQEMNQIEIWKNHLISEEHLQIIYNQLLTINVLNEEIQKNIQECINQIYVFDYSLAKNLYQKGNSQLNNYFEGLIFKLPKILNKETHSKTNYCNILKRFYNYLFESGKDWYKESDLLTFQTLNNINKKAYKQLDYYMNQWVGIFTYIGKQMSLKSKLKIKNKMLKQKDLEQINSEEFLYNCEKLISILIENNQLRHALLLYLLFECDLEIYEIQYLKFDAIKQRKFNLNYEKQGSKISKKVEVSEQIQILCLAIMKKYDLQEQSQILYLNSNRDVQTMLECLKKTYLSKIEQENNQNFIVFLKKFKLSDIKKILKQYTQLKRYDIKSNQFYELISLYLRFEIEINKYGFINQNTIQSQLQPPALKKSKSQLDLIRIQNIQKLEQSTALVLMIEDEQILVKQNLNENNTQIVRQENKFLDRPETEIKDIEIFTENII